MKLYNTVGPNPRMVRMFAAERGVPLELIRVDLRNAENRREPYIEKNPSGTTPALELDDGTVLAEITAICEYLDEIAPGPSLIGSSPEERAITRMWTRRIDHGICENLVNGYRFTEGLPIFESRMRCIPEAGPALKLIVQEKLAWLDGLMEGCPYICGERFSMADIMLFAFLDFGTKINQAFDPDLSRIPTWFAEMAARPSAAA